MAKQVARDFAPPQSNLNAISVATGLVHAVAKWIGQCTVLANRFSFVIPDGTNKMLRDSGAIKARRLPVFNHPFSNRFSRKRPRGSPDSLAGLSCLPFFSP